MPGFAGAVKQGISTALGRFSRAYQDPSQTEGGAVVALQPSYALLWHYYANSAFENLGLWGPYKGHYRLYRQMRLLYNPTRRLCDFYAGHVYPGFLDAQSGEAPAATPVAVPLAEGTDPALRAALDQLWAWSRWQANKGLLVRYGAIAGSVLLEVVDDYEAGRVYLNVVWPSLVSYLDLDPTGAVLAYTLQYPARDDDGTLYTYRKEVDTRQIRFFKDDQPHDYGEGTSYPNPYGVVPAAWIKHRDLGGNVGAPAIHGSIGKIDELNSLASHIHDQVHKVIGAPKLIATDGKIGSLFGNAAQAKRAPTQPYDAADLDREGLLMLTAPHGSTVASLAGDLQLHEAAEHLTMLLTELEHDHPEVTMYTQLRKMTQVTGPAAQRLMGDVAALVDEASANYDGGCARAFALALAIGGWRVATGAWGAALRPEQELFRPFGLEQVHADTLRIRIVPRPLIPMSEAEQLEVQQLRDTVKSGVPTTLTGNLREAIPE